jgi:hypothetical protein
MPTNKAIFFYKLGRKVESKLVLIAKFPEDYIFDNFWKPLKPLLN